MTTAEEENLKFIQPDSPPVVQMTDLCKERDVGIITVFKGPGKDTKADGWPHFLWEVTLMYQKRSYKTEYRMGIGHVHKVTKKPTPPTAADVLSCLCSDATSADRTTFEDWCSEFGYDTDSRKAEKIFKACVDTNAKLRAFLGEDFDLFASAEH